MHTCVGVCALVLNFCMHTLMLGARSGVYAANDDEARLSHIATSLGLVSVRDDHTWWERLLNWCVLTATVV
jgi:hypothetical protein